MHFDWLTSRGAVYGGGRREKREFSREFVPVPCTLCGLPVNSFSCSYAKETHRDANCPGLRGAHGQRSGEAPGGGRPHRNKGRRRGGSSRATADDGRTHRGRPAQRGSAPTSDRASGRDAAHGRFVSGDVQEGEAAIGAGSQTDLEIEIGNWGRRAATGELAQFDREEGG